MKKVKIKSLGNDQKRSSTASPNNHINTEETPYNSELIIKNFLDVINNKTTVKPTGKVKSLSKLVRSVTDLEEEGILDENEAHVLVEFVVQKFIESKFDKILDGLSVDNDYNWFVASSKYIRNH